LTVNTTSSGHWSETDTPHVCSSDADDTVAPMDTIARGNAAEAAVLQALVDAGIHVLVPFGDGLHFDLAAVAPDGSLLRLQVKSGRVRKGCVEFNSSSTDHGTGQQHYRGRADLLAVYVRSLPRIFMVPVEECALFRGYLRLEAARNNQRRRVRMAENYSFEVWVKSLEARLAA
ncbi:MAG: group I intron-associated PD-(D/E)XK endonuclease, partial [Thermoleophilaceae bacterium]